MTCHLFRVLTIAVLTTVTPVIATASEDSTHISGHETAAVEPPPGSSVCRFIFANREAWRVPRNATPSEVDLFRQCAIELSTSENISLNIAVVREGMAPYLLPRALHDQILEVHAIKDVQNELKLATAQRYLAHNYFFETRRGAAYWVNEFLTRGIDCDLTPKALHIMGTYKEKKGEKPIFGSLSDKIANLGTSALLGYAPANVDYGIHLLENPEVEYDRVRGYAQLLVAKAAGVDVSDLLEKHKDSLSPEDLENATIAYKIFQDMRASSDSHC